jgi:hypothetical protein
MDIVSIVATGSADGWLTEKLIEKLKEHKITSPLNKIHEHFMSKKNCLYIQ